MVLEILNRGSGLAIGINPNTDMSMGGWKGLRKIGTLDLSAFCARDAGGGLRNQPSLPAMMVKVLVYGYATGVFSSRRLERWLHEDLGSRTAWEQ